MTAEAPVSSPCLKQCRLDPATQTCTACHRTIDEIINWSKMTEAGRRRIMAELGLRAERNRRAE